jgi:uncharacterized coiled-coil DUF342 family protein
VIEQIAILEQQLAEAKATQARDQKSEAVRKWREALAACYAKRDACNAIAAQLRAAVKRRDEVHAIAGRALTALQEFVGNEIPEGEIDFRFPDEIEAEIARGEKLRQAYEAAARVSQPVNATYGNLLASWLVAKGEFENACFQEQQLRPQPQPRRPGYRVA